MPKHHVPSDPNVSHSKPHPLGSDHLADGDHFAERTTDIDLRRRKEEHDKVLAEKTMDDVDMPSGSVRRRRGLGSVGRRRLLPPILTKAPKSTKLQKQMAVGNEKQIKWFTVC